MDTIANEVRNGKIMVSDGAWGTFLQQKGLGTGECPELWNVEHRTDVLEVARSYVDAGTDMIETNSFGGSSVKLGSHGLSDRASELNRAAAEISREAAGDNVHVLGSVGPSGKFLMMGEITEEELYASFAEQAVALETGGADALVVETMSDLEEAKCAVRACVENTDCEIICTMTFEEAGQDVYKSMMGITPTQMVEALSDSGISVIGANCGKGIEDMIGITREIRSITQEMPILIHPNAGIPEYKEGETIYPVTPEEMAGYVDTLIEAGANIIGGCCGTTPDHIRRIRVTIDNR